MSAGDDPRGPESVGLGALNSYASVRTWLDGLEKHWGGDPENDESERLPTLGAFCRFVGRDPDAIVSETTMLKNGERRIRVKGRKRYTELISEWQSGLEGSRLQRAKRGNAIRSFLIHNGVLLQSGVQS